MGLHPIAISLYPQFVRLFNNLFTWISPVSLCQRNMWYSTKTFNEELFRGQHVVWVSSGNKSSWISAIWEQRGISICWSLSSVLFKFRHLASYSPLWRVQNYPKMLEDWPVASFLLQCSYRILVPQCKSSTRNDDAVHPLNHFHYLLDKESGSGRVNCSQAQQFKWRELLWETQFEGWRQSFRY